jgi:hypothetical protein
MSLFLQSLSKAIHPFERLLERTAVVRSIATEIPCAPFAANLFVALDLETYESLMGDERNKVDLADNLSNVPGDILRM